MTVLTTDLYALTMADSFVRHGCDDLVSFELVMRRLPTDHDGVVVAGVAEAAAAALALRTDADELAWLRADGRFSDALLERLADLRFGGDLHAVPEGAVVPAGVPLLRVSASRVEATLLEPVLLSAINHGTRIATTASDIVAAADGRPVVDFSLRRLDGPAAGLPTARAAYVAGFAGTALPLAGLRHGVPTVGTMAHHYVMARGEADEERAFADFLEDHPGGTTLLVDTFDVERGVRRAIAAQASTGLPLGGVRIDSGDLAANARLARRLLDEAGLPDARVLLSGDLDAASVAELIADGAPVDSFGVGTRLRNGEPLGAVYKLCEQHALAQDDPLRHVMKATPGKETDPGVHQVTRTTDADGAAVHLLHLADEAVDGEPLLRPVLAGGRAVPEALDLEAARARAARERGAPVAPLRRSDALVALRERLGADEAPRRAEAIA